MDFPPGAVSLHATHYLQPRLPLLFWPEAKSSPTWTPWETSKLGAGEHTSHMVKWRWQINAFFIGSNPNMTGFFQPGYSNKFWLPGEAPPGILGTRATHWVTTLILSQCWCFMFRPHFTHCFSFRRVTTRWFIPTGYPNHLELGRLAAAPLSCPELTSVRRSMGTFGPTLS